MSKVSSSSFAVALPEAAGARAGTACGLAPSANPKSSGAPAGCAGSTLRALVASSGVLMPFGATDGSWAATFKAASSAARASG